MASHLRVLLQVLLFVFGQLGTSVDLNTNCFLGLRDPRPLRSLYVEYVQGEHRNFTVSFEIDTCRNQYNSPSLLLSVMEYHETTGRWVSLRYLNDFPSYVWPKDATKLSSEQAAKEKHFKMVPKVENGTIHYGTVQIVVPNYQPNDSCQLRLVMSSHGIEASWDGDSWNGSFIVQQKARIDTRHGGHTEISMQGFHFLIMSVNCGYVVGFPVPDIRWSCAGNDNFWIRTVKGGDKLYGPHNQTQLDFVEYGDDEGCQGEARSPLKCFVTNMLVIDGLKTTFNDSVVVDTTGLLGVMDHTNAES